MITPENRHFEQHWHLKIINVPDAWQLLNAGSNVVNGNANEIVFGSPNIIIGQIDSGVQTRGGVVEHEGLSGIVSDNNDKAILFLDDEAPIVTGNADSEGIHGTEVAGIITSKARQRNAGGGAIPFYDGAGVVGVSPNSKYISISSDDAAKAVGFIYYMSGLADLALKFTDYNYITNLNRSDKFTIFGLLQRIYRNNTFLNIINNNPIAFNNGISVFNFSQLISTTTYASPILNGVFEHLTSFSRKGRGIVICAGAGNSGVQTNTEQGMSLYDYPLIVGATEVHNDYFNITAPNTIERRASYSSFGNELDIVAPAGNLSSIQPDYSRRKLYATTIHNGGDFYTNSPLRLQVTNKRSNTSLELDNVNGVYKGQFVSIGDPADINNFEIRRIESVNTGNNRIRLNEALYYTRTLVFNAPNDQIEVAPLYTSLTNPVNNTNLLNVQSTKGFAVGQEAYIGTLGNGSAGQKEAITAITPTTITLASNINVPAIAGIYVIPEPPSKNITTIHSTTSCDVNSTDGLFVGGAIFIPALGINEVGFIRSITGSAIRIGGLSLSGVSTGSDIECVGFGHCSSDFLGTSGATPIVSGVASLVLSAKPTLNVFEVNDILKGNADKIDASDPSWTTVGGRDFSINYGFGRVNAQRAVQAALNYNHDNRKLMMRDNLPPGGDIHSPDIWVRPGSNTQAVTTIQESGLGLHIEPNFTEVHKINIRVINQGDTLPSLKGGYVRCLLAFTNTLNPNFEFPDRWIHQFDANDGKHILWIGSAEINTPIPANDANVVPANPVTWNEHIVEIDWDTRPHEYDNTGAVVMVGGNPKDSLLNWRNINPKGLNAYLLVHVAPFDGPDNEVSLTNIADNKQLTYKPIAPLFVRFTSDTDANFNEIENNEVPLDGSTVTIPFYSKLYGVHQSKLTTTYLKLTLKKTDGSPDEVIKFLDEGGSWGYDPNGVPDWIIVQSPVITNSHVPDVKNMSFESGLTVSNLHSKVTIEVIDESTPGTPLVVDKLVYQLSMPANIPQGIRQKKTQIIHTFTDFSIITQSDTEAYGPVKAHETTKFRTSAMFSSGTTQKAYAVTGGTSFIQEISGTNLINLILKPDEQPIVNGVNVKYFVYRGLKKESFLKADGTVLSEAEVSGNDLLARMWQVKNEWNQQQHDIKQAMTPPQAHTPEDLKREDFGMASNPANKLPNSELIDKVFLDHTFQKIIEGWELGEFETSGSFGFEVIVEYPGHYNTLSDVRVLDHIIEAQTLSGGTVDNTTLGEYNKLYVREKVLGYIDPAAYFGLFYDFNIKNHVGANVDKIASPEIRTLVIDKFFTKDNIYLDIRNELGNSINLYHDYKSATNVLDIKLNGSNESYEYSGWPILKVDIAGGALTEIKCQLPMGNNTDPILYLVSGAFDSSANKFKILAEVPGTGLTDEFKFQLPTKNSVVYPYYFRVNYNKRYQNFPVAADPLETGLLNKRSSYDNIFPFQQITTKVNATKTVWNTLNEVRYLGVTSIPNNNDFNIQPGIAKDTIGETVYGFVQLPIESNGVDSYQIPSYPLGLDSGESQEPTFLHFLNKLKVVNTITMGSNTSLPLVDFVKIHVQNPTTILEESMDNFYSVSYSKEEGDKLIEAANIFVSGFPVYMVFQDGSYSTGVINKFKLALQGIVLDTNNNTYKVKITAPTDPIWCYSLNDTSKSFFSDAYAKAYKNIVDP